MPTNLEGTMLSLLSKDDATRAARWLKDNMTEPGDGGGFREERREPSDVWDVIDALRAHAETVEQIQPIVEMYEQAKAAAVAVAEERGWPLMLGAVAVGPGGPVVIEATDEGEAGDMD